MIIKQCNLQLLAILGRYAYNSTKSIKQLEMWGTGGGRTQNTFPFYSTGNYDLVHKSEIVQYTL